MAEHGVGAAEDGEGGVVVLGDVGDGMVEEFEGEVQERRGGGCRLGFAWEEAHFLDRFGKGEIVCLRKRGMFLE